MKKLWTVPLSTLVVACGLGDAPQAATRPIERPIPQGLLESERNTIQVFRRASPSVVFITNSRQVHSFRGLNVTEIPQGSGFKSFGVSPGAKRLLDGGTGGE